MNLINKATGAARAQGYPKVLSKGRTPLSGADRLERGLGWFSIGLGLAELIAPRQIARALGMEGRETLIRAYGLREIGAGIVSLSVDKQLGLWMRVAGDVVDLATLIPALRDDNPKRENVGAALALVMGITTLDLVDAQQVTAQHSRGAETPRDYSDRSGFPGGIEQARGAARKDFDVPRDMQAAPAFPPVPRQASPGSV